MQEAKSTITITYTEGKEGYGEHREIEGSFGKLQLMRTLVGLYNDVVLGSQHQANEVPVEALEMLAADIEKTLKYGEKLYAN